MAIYREVNGEMVKEWEGLVLDDRELNDPYDSDWYAIVFDPKENKLRKVFYRTTRFGGTDRNYVTLDASEEVKTKAEAALAELLEHRLFNEYKEEAKRVQRGNRIRFIRNFRSRKLNMTVPKDEEGTVFWVGANQYDRTGRSNRYGVELSNGQRVFVGEHTIEAVGVIPSRDEIRSKALEGAKSRIWIAGLGSRHMIV